MAYYGHVPPDVFDEMDEDDTVAFAEHIETERKAHEEMLFEAVKLVISGVATAVSRAVAYSRS